MPSDVTSVTVTQTKNVPTTFPQTPSPKTVTTTNPTTSHFVVKLHKLLNFQWIHVSYLWKLSLEIFGFKLMDFLFEILVPPDTRTIRGCGYDESNYKVSSFMVSLLSSLLTNLFMNMGVFTKIYTWGYSQKIIFWKFLTETSRNKDKRNLKI